jgi:ribosomal-protein-alanine N-acetyltransferase
MHGRYHIRLMRQRDLDAILQVEHASFGKDAYDRKLFAEYSHTCGELFLVAEGAAKGAAERSRRVCGYSLTCARADRAELVSIAVDPAARGKGIASTLLESTLRRLRRRKVARLSLMVRLTNVVARGFYEKYGFTKVRTVRGYYEDGGDGLLMRSVL